MNKPQLISNLQICTCPFCGISIEADIAQILSQPPTQQVVEIDLRKPCGPKLIVFNGNRRVDIPCRHVVDLAIEGWIAPARSMNNATYRFRFNWKHEWLLRNDPDEILVPFAWDVLDHDEFEPFCPTSPHDREMFHEGIEYPLPQTDEVLRFEGDLFTAEDPVEYFEELQACERRFQRQSA